MAVALERRRLTVDEFHRMAASGVVDHEERLELWDGEIVEMSPIAGRHAHVVRRLNRMHLDDRATGSDGYGDVAHHEDGMVMAMGVPVDVAALV